MARIIDKTFKYIKYGALEEFIKEIYNVQVDLLVEEEWRNGSCIPYKVKGELNEYWDLDLVGIVLSGEPSSYGACRVMLEKLAVDGHIEPGEYLIEAYW